jgi:hypothetical protein
MGGPTSGNYGGRPTVEGGLVLDLYRLLRQRVLGPGSRAGSIVWSEVYSGRETARIGYESFMGEDSGRVRLTYTITSPWSGEKHSADYWVQLVTTAQPFGGRRWWWVCPRTGDLVSKLYLPSGGRVFASRKAYRLGYRSQRESPHDRALSRAFKLRRRLGSNGGIGDYIERPKGMRQRTFDRMMERVEKAEAVCNANLLRFVQQLAGRQRR